MAGLGINGNWSDGVLECWSIDKLLHPTSNHHSITPVLHYSGRCLSAKRAITQTFPMALFAALRLFPLVGT